MSEHLLVVEDERNLAEAIADNLEIEGYRVEVCEDGAQALERIRAEQPALVLLDVMLPSLDGFSICEQLRAEDNHVPILFLTANAIVGSALVEVLERNEDPAEYLRQLR